MILYRGLGLPKDAIDSYKKMAGTNTRIEFNGFTSTSATLDIAKRFARQAEAPNKIPCVLELKVTDYGNQLAYLKDSEYTAFPSEKEILLAGCPFYITEVVEDTQDGIVIIKLL